MGFLGSDKRPAHEPDKQGARTKTEKAKLAHDRSGVGFSAGNTDNSRRGRGRGAGHYNRDDE